MDDNGVKMLQDALIPKRYRERFKFDQGEGRWRDVGKAIYRKVGTGFTMALIGKSGVGKTQLAANVIFNICNHQKLTCRFACTMDFFLDLKASFKPQSADSAREVIEGYCAPRFLVMDEYDKRGETYWEDQTLSYLFDRRYAAMKDTLIISNQTPEDFQQSIGLPVVSRMNESGGIIVCDWPSFREGTCG